MKDNVFQVQNPTRFALVATNPENLIIGVSISALHSSSIKEDGSQTLHDASVQRNRATSNQLIINRCNATVCCIIRPTLMLCMDGEGGRIRIKARNNLYDRYACEQQP